MANMKGVWEGGARSEAMVDLLGYHVRGKMFHSVINTT